jgi:hypothetical protein
MYIYTDHNTGKYNFTCQANNLIEADLLFKAKFGIDPSKLFYVGCEIKA